MENTADALEPVGRNGGGDILEWQVGGHQGHAQAASGQHHHHLPGCGQIGEKFGVAGEGNARFVDHALVHRGGDHSGEQSVEAALSRAGQGFQHIAGVLRFQLARPGCDSQGRVPDVEAAGRSRSFRQVGWIGFDQLNRQAQFGGTLLEQVATGDGDQGVGLGGAGE
ncbi:hypothetical protein D9M70_206320 [compost metagenome]